MSVNPSTPPAPASPAGEQPNLWLERTAMRQFTAHNSRGAHIEVGHGPGQFNPGELLRIALAGCQAMCADWTYKAMLGTEEYAMQVIPEADYDSEADRFTHIDVRLLADLSMLSAPQQAELAERALAGIAYGCTVGHSIEDPVPFATHFEDTSTLRHASDEVGDVAGPAVGSTGSVEE